MPDETPCKPSTILTRAKDQLLVIMSSVCGDAFLPTTIVVLHSTPIACSPHAS